MSTDSPFGKAKVQEVTLELVPMSAVCMLHGHKFDMFGRCQRMAPSLSDKNAPPVRCGGVDPNVGFTTLSPQANIMNVITPKVENLCFWYDGSLKPAKGHNGLCKWDFDGQIWRHL